MRIFGYSGIWKSNNEDVVQGCRLELELWLRLFAQVRQCDCRIPAHASGMKRGKKSGWCAEPAQREAGAVKLADGWDLVCSHSPSHQARATNLFNNAKDKLTLSRMGKLASCTDTKNQVSQRLWGSAWKLANNSRIARIYRLVRMAAFLEGMLTSLDPALDQHCLPIPVCWRSAAGLYWSCLRVHEPLRESYTALAMPSNSLLRAFSIGLSSCIFNHRRRSVYLVWRR